MPAIRNFPEPNQNVLDEKRKKPFISLEELIKRQDDYLPISELDLRVFIKELKLVINNFMKNNKKFKPEEIFLTGINSLYPEIVDLISNKLNLKTTRIKTITQESFGNVNVPSELFPQELSRIFGLALSLQNGESATQIVNGKKLNDNSENIQKIKKIINEEKFSNQYNASNIKTNNNINLIVPDNENKKLKNDEETVNQESVNQEAVKGKKEKEKNKNASEKSIKNEPLTFNE